MSEDEKSSYLGVGDHSGRLLVNYIFSDLPYQGEFLQELEAWMETRKINYVDAVWARYPSPYLIDTIAAESTGYSDNDCFRQPLLKAELATLMERYHVQRVDVSWKRERQP